MTVLAVKDIARNFGGIRAVDGVSFEAEQAEIVGIIGPNGSGKSTLFNLLTGTLKPTAGTITLFDRDITKLPAYKIARAGLGRTFQTSSVFPALSALENVRLAAQARSGGSLRLWGSTKGSVRRAKECLAQVRLADRADHHMVYLAAFAYVESVVAAGIQVYRYEDGFLHQKVVLVDDIAATVGSANFDNRSFRLNFELTAIVADAAFTRDMEEMLEADFARARRVAPDELAARSFPFRFAVRLCRLASPVL